MGVAEGDEEKRRDERGDFRLVLRRGPGRARLE